MRWRDFLSWPSLLLRETVIVHHPDLRAQTLNLQKLIIMPPMDLSSTNIPIVKQSTSNIKRTSLLSLSLTFFNACNAISADPKWKDGLESKFLAAGSGPFRISRVPLAAVVILHSRYVRLLAPRTYLVLRHWSEPQTEGDSWRRSERVGDAPIREAKDAKIPCYYYYCAWSQAHNPWNSNR